MNPWLPPEQQGETGWQREMKLAEKLVAGGVFLHPGEEKSVRKGWFRLVYTNRREIIAEGLRRLETVLKGVEW